MALAVIWFFAKNCPATCWKLLRVKLILNLKSVEIDIQYLWEKVKDQENKISKPTADSDSGCIRLQTHTPLPSEIPPLQSTKTRQMPAETSCIKTALDIP